MDAAPVAKHVPALRQVLQDVDTELNGRVLKSLLTHVPARSILLSNDDAGGT